MQQEKSTANPRSTTPFQQQQSQQQQQNSKEEQDEVTELIDGGERVQSGGDRSRSNDAEISVLEMRKESETMTDGSGWVHSSVEVVVSVEGRVEATGIALIGVKGPTRPPPEPPDPNLKMVVTGGETQRETDSCLKTMLEASSCTTEGKAELHGADNATDLSPITVVLGETATTKMFESARYRTMDAGGEHDTSNSSAVASERRRTLAARTPVATIGEGAASILGGGPRAQAVNRAMLLNPPPLIAAMFPWNRDKGSAAAAGNGAEDSAFAKGKVEDEAAKVVERQKLALAIDREALVMVAAIGSRTGLSEKHH
ncbi:hypothetical protein PIB30_069843 [Stylosanthes scabra]|uniref:Uncharacterized protein n=1 Tax=Stylosanthes scabra TaxID=79078 RepID=A0ABU6QP35_9FABA|nr:hypothetical protein [Stylosanthes scabra]